MLGLALKGGVWIGFGGLFLGMGLSGTRYRPAEVMLLLAGAVGLFFLGIWLVNSPYDPTNKQLPFLYFSDHWQFEPGRWEQGLIKPRYETFGGYWAALIGLALYARVIRGDRLALRMAAFGVLGGAMGFPGGQCIQSAHAWHPDWFQEGGRFGFGEALFRTFNWWNVMETTFGAIWGAVVGLGLWLNRRLINVDDTNDRAMLPAPVEVVLAVVYASFVLAGEFEYLNPQDLPIHTLDFLQTHPFEFVSYWYIEIGIVIVSLPLIGISGGRLSPYVAILLLIPMTICGKTLRAVGHTTDDTSVWFQNYGLAWYMLVQVPLAIGLVIAAWLIQKASEHTTARAAGVSLFVMSSVYFCLNSAFFGFPDVLEPIEQWGGRHANQAFFLLSTICLMLTSVMSLLAFPACFQCAETRQLSDD